MQRRPFGCPEPGGEENVETKECPLEMLVHRGNIHFCRGSGRPVVETKPPSVVVRWRPPCLAWHEIGYTTSKMWLACHMSWHCLGICLFDMGDFARWLRTCLFVQNVLLKFLLRSTLLPCLTTCINVICFVFGVDDFSCDFPCDIKTNHICTFLLLWGRGSNLVLQFR